MHPEFQKWSWLGPWFSKDGAHTKICWSNDICHLLITKSRINCTLNMGHLAAGSSNKKAEWLMAQLMKHC